ncbi:DUF368 domain-containing protein [Corynebacterium belfantii]|uniref:DUF368 domain-containing protein n=1 Tax=Corynebacterium belfantii TaxID=2014537 RepID=UPI000B4C0DDF|nr:DUF368 domain-containing protein [Corynebacterium belfantii]OWM38689.1 hypothetical protein AZF07_04100 [Corynebacterium diphtheriae subsp. lausannense]MBG9243315.1 DUF368 domain-containing protein [Corynebacterium belfantii]MBG9326433.1 DUF368 domain-containing protein [Corynebacterium belfantii]MBG9349882.1 DUF368 domain-containing protein [Corynebacterium belfantii]SNW31561.1 hypothetical protein FRC0043_01218 [Corynebacterium belfantii]
MTSPVKANTNKTRPINAVINVVFGALIGLAELVPGVSGGTVALVAGIYERAIHNGNALVHIVRVLIGDRSQLKTSIKSVEWGFLASVAVGMIGAVFTMSSVMHHFVDHHPVTARALFLGMVAVSIVVPLRMIRAESLSSQKLPALLLFVIGAIATFFATSMTSEPKTAPSLLIVFFVAMIAVCALVLPGVSGSFILLALGFYEPIIQAVSDRSFTIIAVFAAGAITGLACFIKVLDVLMTRHHTLTLATMAGMMLGSLRALWPWQTDNADLLWPSANSGTTFGFIALGAVVVACVVFAEILLERKNSHHK